MFFLVVKRLLLYGHRRFGTVYRSHFQGLDVNMDILIFEDGKDKMSRNVGYLTSKVAQQPRKTKVSTNRRRNFEVSYVHSGAENVLDNYRGGLYESVLCANKEYEMK